MGAPKGSLTKLVPSQSLGILRSNSRSTKLLIPANQPFRVKVPQKGPHASIPSSMKSEQKPARFASGNREKILVDDDEVQHLPIGGITDTQYTQD